MQLGGRTDLLCPFICSVPSETGTRALLLHQPTAESLMSQSLYSVYPREWHSITCVQKHGNVSECVWWNVTCRALNGRKVTALHPKIVSIFLCQKAPFRARSYAPQLHVTIWASRYQVLAIGRESYSGYGIVVSLHNPEISIAWLQKCIPHQTQFPLLYITHGHWFSFVAATHYRCSAHN
jgi:hypothetical protein